MSEAVCFCDACGAGEPLGADEVFAISPFGGIPTDPSPSARGGGKVYMLLCRKKFLKLYGDHGHAVTADALAQSQAVALRHLRLKGKL